MQPSIEITQEFKDAVYKEIIDAMVAGLRNGDLYENDSTESAGYVLDGMEKVTNMQELIDLLAALARRWEAYRPVFLKYKSNELIGKIEGELTQLSNPQ